MSLCAEMPTEPGVPVVEFSPSGKPAEAPAEAPEVAPVEEKKPEAPPAESERSKWFAKMARQEQARVQREQALKAREKAAEDREKALADREARLAGAKTAPLEALKAAGLTYDDVTNAQLNDGKPSPELVAKQALEEVERLRKELAAKEEAQRSEATTQAQQAKEAARREFYGEAAAFVQAGGETYELLNLYKPYHLVAQRIEEEHQKSGKVLSYAEAAQTIEAQLQAEVDKATSTKWFSARKPVAPQPITPAKPRATISNDLTAATPPVPKRNGAVDPIKAAIARYEESRRSQSQH